MNTVSRKKSEILSTMKNEALGHFSPILETLGATQIGVSEYAIPVADGYVTVTFTAKNPIGTVKVPAFSLEKAVAGYNDLLLEREMKAQEKAAKKAAREAKDSK